MAKQYGMPLDEFWYGDPELYNVYKKSYYRNLYATAWVNGLHEYKALLAFGNIYLNFKGKDNPQMHYPEEAIVPFENKKVITKETMESEYRELQKNQSDFIRSLLKNKK